MLNKTLTFSWDPPDEKTARQYETENGAHHLISWLPPIIYNLSIIKRILTYRLILKKRKIKYKYNNYQYYVIIRMKTIIYISHKKALYVFWQTFYGLLIGCCFPSLLPALWLVVGLLHASRLSIGSWLTPVRLILFAIWQQPSF